MFSKYYMSELAYLRELGRAFGLSNPGVAGHLIEGGADPDVERLLEGFAFLTARIRERVENDIPELVHVLADLLLPHYLRPLPACTIVELTPQLRALRGRTRVAAGTELAARPVDGTSCAFRTTADVDLLPVTLEDVVLDRSSATSPVLHLVFETTEQGRAELFKPGGSLRLFIHAELVTSSHILLWLLRYCRGVELRGASGRTVRLGPGAVHPVGFDRDFRLLPWPHAPEGYRQLQEYLTLPDKFVFFEVRQLEAARGIIVEDRFEVSFLLERPPATEARIGRETFRLHCAPAINLFPASAHPVRHRTLDREHLLRAADLPAEHAEIYSVDSVTGIRTGRNERHHYKPFYDFAHAMAEEDRQRTFYRLRRALSPVHEGIDTWLQLDTARDVAAPLGEELLSVELTCTNRSLPARLQVGDVCLPTPSSPINARFRNITPVSRPTRPPLGTELHWRLLSHLAANQQSLSDAAGLRRLLDLYNFHALTDNLAARTNRLRINALRTAQVRAGTRFLEGVAVRGNRTTLELDESGFLGVGDAFLFGCILDELLATNVTLNAFHELAIRLLPSQTEYTWAPRNGAKMIC
ncbi:type VI secretion system baseplate subunit TssF [Pyxidicoccus xibeiensis]|uniref:type VI secretion system baseplate subunit TssF n=1 Tax=Pyxidicoccus xibeiensis TaxID=2906759 RepID=UPI0020A82BC4|nr:type VI secretion system baseplate subunit TssF [Pyxidicoccus xibeiensis]MCP3140665.1 type VI secretion system baseplate subunit TssF [Pyxidicoccus xibeiensis]